MQLLHYIFHVWLVFTALISPHINNSTIPQNNKSPVKIGLLISGARSSAARNGAEMAILKANENGGVNGVPFKLVVRSMEGPWGTGSKQAVDLIFEENVWAIMGSHDGRNAHLVEQAITKIHVVFLSAWAGDPTLSQAFVPWYFSCVPNANQQADALIKEISNNMNVKKIAVISNYDYDSKTAMRSFLEKVKFEGKQQPMIYAYNNPETEFPEMAGVIKKIDANCIVLCGNPSSSMKIIEKLHQAQINIPVYGTLSLLDENELSYNELQCYENVIMISPRYWLRPEGIKFVEDYKIEYGNSPGAVAAYAYDGMNILIEAVRNAGNNRDNMQKEVSKTDYHGITGEIRFDEKGNLIGKAELMKIKNGVPVGFEAK
jgi:branched-chain amino acid transport system substrate-binding protein